MQKIRIGTRDSALALWQANDVATRLSSIGYSCEIVAISTKGDQILDRSLSKIGSKGVFTEELEAMLREGTIDIAQHSAKDLPSTLPPDLQLIAFTEREDAHDVVLSLNPDFKLGQSQKQKIGTSSTRRRAFLSHFYPNIHAVEMRGNLQTRLEKLKSGSCDAMLLAFAGVHRMGMEGYISEHLHLDQFVPAVGQGSVAIQTSIHIDAEMHKNIRHVCNHDPTEKCILAERQVLAQLDGGCSVPVFGHAFLEKEMVNLTAGVLSLDGSVKLTVRLIGNDPVQVATEVSNQLIHQGAQTLLKEIRQQLAQS